jgi:hypothetical protein
MREYQVRICEGLGVKVPGPTRQRRPSCDVSDRSALPPRAAVMLRAANGREVPCVDGSELARRIFTSQGLVGAAMCSACERGSHDRWP